jgi:hypothetical protein
MARQLRGQLTSFVVLLLVCPWAQSIGKKIVNSGDDLPRFSYPVKGSASGLVGGEDAAFNAFAAKVGTDLNAILRDYDIADKATMRDLLNEELELQMLGGEYDAALHTVDELHGEQEKPSAKLMVGIYERAWLQAAIETKSTAGPAFEQSFGKRVSEAVNPLPWDVVQDDVKLLYAQAKVYTATFAIADAKTDLDPAAEKSGALDNRQAAQLLFGRYGVRIFVPIGAPLVDALKPYITAHTVIKPDIWAAREITLGAADKTTPVLVAIWDSGIDVSWYPDQVFTDPHPTASGDHGLAYDEKGNPTKRWLHPLTAEQEKVYPGFREQVKGFLDLQNGIDSPDADAVQKRFKTLSTDRLHEVFEAQKFVIHYLHGTHCAGIAARGNAAARLVVVRFNDNLPDLPFPPTEEWARRLAADFRAISDYYKTRHVRRGEHELV